MYTCANCAVLACANNEPDKMPKNCPMRNEPVMADARSGYALAENHDFYVNCSAIEGLGYCQWPRLKETVEFCKRMSYHKLGLAFCKGLRKEARIVADLLREHGFEVVSVICKTGGISKEEVGIPEEVKIHPGEFEAMCNPIAQAKLLNEQHTEFNIEIGLCVGHDSMFYKYSDAMVTTLVAKDRVFLGSNKGGVAKEHSFDFTQEDLEYIKGFNLIYTNLNSYIEEDLPFLHTAGVPIAYDFSTRWTDAYLEKVCPYVTVAILSCAHLSAEDRAREMQKAADHGVSIVLGTIGEDGSYVLYNGKTYYASAVHADDVIDTMGAGDSYFAAFLCSLLKSSKSGALLEGTEEENVAHLQEAMQIGAAFAAKMCAKEGAFGYGTPIVGRTEL